MKVEESEDIERDESRSEGPPLRGQGPKSGVAKTIVWLAALLVVAGVVAYRGIYTRVRAASEVKIETRELAVPSVSVARPKRGSPQQEIVLPGNVQAFI